VKRLWKFCALCVISLFFSLIALFGRAALFFSPARKNGFLGNASHWWTRSAAAVLGLSVVRDVLGEELSRENFLLVANHQSYLDMVVIGCAFAAIFVAKKDVKQWPILGGFVSLGGTLFVDRDAFRGTVESVKEIEEALVQGVNVQIFPEGTSTNGDQVLPFKSSLFNAAVHANAKILPITIAYLEIDEAPFSPLNRDSVCWYGSMNFAEHFWKLLAHRSIVASLTVHPPIPPDYYPGVKQLAELAHYRISRNNQSIKA